MRLTVDPKRGVIARRADNVIVQSEGFRSGGADVPTISAFAQFGPDLATAELVARYVAAAKPEGARVVGRLDAPATRKEDSDRENSAGNLIADAQLAASRGAGAEIAFINAPGIRTDLIPAADGRITFADIFAMQPFGNSLVVKTLSGVQLKALLEQQFASGTNSVGRPVMLMPSAGFTFAYDLARGPGERIVEMRLAGRPIDPERRYRVSVNNFMTSGGDNFTVLANGTDAVDAGSDVEALEAFLRGGAQVPATDRVRAVAR